MENAPFNTWKQQLQYARHTKSKDKVQNTNLASGNVITMQMSSKCTTEPLQTVCVCSNACHASMCVRICSLPHLVAIRMCASVTVKQHKCVAQMERRGRSRELSSEGYTKKQQNGKHVRETLPDSKRRQNDLAGGCDGQRRQTEYKARIL